MEAIWHLQDPMSSSAPWPALCPIGPCTNTSAHICSCVFCFLLSVHAYQQQPISILWDLSVKDNILIYNHNHIYPLLGGKMIYATKQVKRRPVTKSFTVY